MANYLGFSRFADRLIRSGKYDLVQVEWVESALLIGRHTTPLVLDAHDVISKLAERFAQQKTGLAGVMAQLLLLLVRAVETRIMRRFDTVITLSDFDRNYLQPLLPEQDVRTISIPAGLDMTDRSFEREAQTLLFFASYRYRPVNVTAALWFYRQVLPLIRCEFPEVRFVIAGYGPPQCLTELAVTDSAVRVTGFVDDSEEYYKRATVFVAPILAGGGIIVKILDALAAGAPVVTTGYGNEGIGGVPGRDLLIADEASQFAEAVIAILKDPALAGRLSANGRAFADENYGLDAAIAKIESLYGELALTCKCLR